MINKNNKGSILDLFIWMAVAFVAILFFAAWIYGFGMITDTLAGMNEPLFDNPNNSIANISADTFGKVDGIQTNSLHILAFAMIFFMGLAIPITNFIQKSHPVFFVVFLLIIIAAFITSVYISNQYEKLMTNEVLGNEITEFTGASFIMLNLPIWVSVIGVMGAIFLFAGIMRDYGAGGSAV